MSYDQASILSRIEDIITKFVRKLSPFAKKLMYIYTSGASIETQQVEGVISRRMVDAISKIIAKSSQTENAVTRAVLRIAVVLYVIFSFVERRIVIASNRFARALLSIQSSLEDAVSYASLYMNILFVVAILAVVVIVWIL